MRKRRWQDHQHPGRLPRWSPGLCSLLPALPPGGAPSRSCGMGLKLRDLGGQRRLTYARPGPAGTLGHWEDMGLGLDRVCVASRCGDCLIFPRAPAQARLSSRQTTLTLGGGDWSPAHPRCPSLCTRPAFHRSSEQAAEGAVTGRQAGLPCCCRCSVGAHSRGQGWGRAALAVTQRPGRVGSPGGGRGGGGSRGQSEPAARTSPSSPAPGADTGPASWGDHVEDDRLAPHTRPVCRDRPWLYDPSPGWTG